jgi:hypothetical protein
MIKQIRTIPAPIIKNKIIGAIKGENFSTFSKKYDAKKTVVNATTPKEIVNVFLFISLSIELILNRRTLKLCCQASASESGQHQRLVR